jgi:transposase
MIMDKAWAGVDAGKEFHWAHVLDASGRELLSRKVENDEADILKLIDEALSLAEEVLWAVDQPGGSTALLLALLWERDQKVLYVSGLTVDRARDAYRGESKTDARDARLIAEQARMRSDLSELKAGEQEIAELQLLLGRRRDLITDKSRTITRLREALLSLFPALERELDMNSKGPLILLTHYQSPAQLRRAGHKRLATYLKNRGVKGSNKVADKALAAAKTQSVTLPAQDVAASIVAELAEDVLGLKGRIENIDEELGKRFFARPEARILTSLPGMGPILGAEFLVAVGDIRAFESADRLAAYAGLVPAARDSGKRVGNHRFLGVVATKPSSGSSTSQPLPACAALLSHGSSTSARGQRARDTLRLSLLWRVGGSTYFGRCCVTVPPSRPDLRLDIFIEILLARL